MEEVTYAQQQALVRWRLQQVRDRLSGELAKREKIATDAERRQLAEQRKKWAPLTSRDGRAAAYIRDLLATAPPLTPEQRATLAAIFKPGMQVQRERIAELKLGKATVEDLIGSPSVIRRSARLRSLQAAVRR